MGIWNANPSFLAEIASYNSMLEQGMTPFLLVFSNHAHLHLEWLVYTTMCCWLPNQLAHYYDTGHNIPVTPTTSLSRPSRRASNAQYTISTGRWFIIYQHVCRTCFQLLSIVLETIIVNPAFGTEWIWLNVSSVIDRVRCVVRLCAYVGYNWVLIIIYRSTVGWLARKDIHVLNVSPYHIVTWEEVFVFFFCWYSIRFPIIFFYHFRSISTVQAQGYGDLYWERDIIFSYFPGFVDRKSPSIWNKE